MTDATRNEMIRHLAETTNYTAKFLRSRTTEELQAKIDRLASTARVTEGA